MVLWLGLTYQLINLIGNASTFSHSVSYILFRNLVAVGDIFLPPTFLNHDFFRTIVYLGTDHPFLIFSPFTIEIVS